MHFFTKAGVVKAVDDVSFARRARAHPRHRRRVGLGQVDDRLLDHGPGRRARAHRRRAHRARTARTSRALDEARLAQAARQPHRDDLPGPDDDAEPGAAHRHADGRGGARAPRRVARERARALPRGARRRSASPSPDERLRSYPHQFSGGMRQRVAIAIALLNKPDLIIADEPTTALDVTIQGQILYEMQKLCRETGTGLIWITHDLSVIVGPRRRGLRDVRRAHRRVGHGRRRPRPPDASLHARPPRLGAEPQRARAGRSRRSRA